MRFTVDKVSCSFCRHRGKDVELKQIEVAVPTGSSAFRLRLRQAALDVAGTQDAQQWAMPGLVHDSTDWLVYRGNTAGRPDFIGRYPTRDAAEMVMIHGAE